MSDFSHRSSLGAMLCGRTVPIQLQRAACKQLCILAHLAAALPLGLQSQQLC